VKIHEGIGVEGGSWFEDSIQMKVMVFILFLV